MNSLYIDCFSGISGDKFVAALLSLLQDNNYLIEELKKLDLNEEFSVNISNKNVLGIDSTKFDVIIKEHYHNHPDHHHSHRNLFDIYSIIDNSSISENAKKISKGIFEILAKAESKVHNKDINEIHFHEIGAIDSIVDIVSAAILIDKLNIQEIISSPIPLGKGFVQCSHGLIPIPAPATVEILKGVPVYSTDIEKELTTPTGAAIIKYFVNSFSNLNISNIQKIGYGAGNYNLEIPNVLRVYLLNNNLKFSTNNYIVKIETNIDDSTPEQLGLLFDNLFELGAKDVFITPILMKKNRLAHLLTVLCEESIKEKIKNEIFKNSTTFGLRESFELRTILDREFKTIEIDNVKIKVKIGKINDKIIKSSIEYDDLKNAIKILNKSYDELLSLIKKKID